MRFLLFFLACISTVSWAQTDSPITPFGQVSVAELKMKQCPFDSSAAAMILFDKGEAVMDISQGLTFRRHVRIKIFNKDAADQWATKVVYYSKMEDSFIKFKASTYNLVNDKIIETKVGDEGLFKGKFDKYTNQARFTLPQVVAGSIIEYTYTISSNELYGPPDWQFQYEIPVGWSEYQTFIPSYFTFQEDLQGFYYPIKTKGKGDSDVRILSNIPAFKAEPSISSEENYISKLRLFVSEIWVPGQPVRKVIKSWGSIARGVYEGDLGIQIRGSGFLKKIVEEQTAGIIEADKKVSKLYDFVRQNVSWNEFTDVIPDRPFKEVLDSKKGSSSEINAMLVSLLQKADIDASPVLIRDREDGEIKPFLPVFKQFNDLICMVKIGDKVMLLDATEPTLPQHVLPERCLNGEGLMIAKDYFEWIPLTSAKSRKNVSCDLKLDDSGQLSGKVTYSRDGSFGMGVRKNYKAEGQEKYVKALAESRSWEISKSTFENMDDAHNPAKEVHDLTIGNAAQATGSMIYLNPFFTERLEENPFRLEERKYPVDFGAPFDLVYMGKIEIPAGYVVEELPKAKAMALPEQGGRYTFNLTTTGNVISVVSQMIINKATYTTEQYPLLREFYAQIVAKQAEQIVLKKQ